MTPLVWRAKAKLTARGTEAGTQKTTVEPERPRTTVEPGGAKGMEGCGLAGGMKSCGKTRVTSDQGRPGGMTIHGGDEEAWSQGEANGSEG